MKKHKIIIVAGSALFAIILGSKIRKMAKRVKESMEDLFSVIEPFPVDTEIIERELMERNQNKRN